MTSTAYLPARPDAAVADTALFGVGFLIVLAVTLVALVLVRAASR